LMTWPAKQRAVAKSVISGRKRCPSQRIGSGVILQPQRSYSQASRVVNIAFGKSGFAYIGTGRNKIHAMPGLHRISSPMTIPTSQAPNFIDPDALSRACIGPWDDPLRGCARHVRTLREASSGPTLSDRDQRASNPRFGRLQSAIAEPKKSAAGEHCWKPMWCTNSSAVSRRASISMPPSESDPRSGWAMLHISTVEWAVWGGT
jgi:hypothetical protein